jgi:hypothetical protein
MQNNMQIKERPILFQGDMVRALLDGRKGQTRRLVKPQPEVSDKGHLMGEWLRKPLDGLLLPQLQDITIHCPFGQIGDRLWVRESIVRGYCGDMDMSRYAADGMPTVADAWPWKRNNLASIHCPRGLSRILLEVTGVRVERLNDISEADAKAEGCEPSIVGADLDHLKYRAGYQTLWERINSDVIWEANPYVWVVAFRRIWP